MSGRTVQIPEAEELVALGVAAEPVRLVGEERPGRSSSPVEHQARDGSRLRCRATMKPGTASAERVD